MAEVDGILRIEILTVVLGLFYKITEMVIAMGDANMLFTLLSLVETMISYGPDVSTALVQSGLMDRLEQSMTLDLSGRSSPFSTTALGQLECNAMTTSKYNAIRHTINVHLQLCQYNTDRSES